MGIFQKYRGAWRTAEFGLAMAAALSALPFGNDFLLMAVTLAVGILFSQLGVWTSDSLDRRAKSIWAVIALTVFVAEGLGLYVHAVSGGATADQNPLVARVSIDPDDPEKLKDGTYYRPIVVTNEGPSDINGSYLAFYQRLFTDRPTSAQQEAAMNALEADARIKIPSASTLQDTGSPLAAGDSRVLRETMLKLTQQQEGSIEAAKLFPLSGVILVYSDDTARATGDLYFTERCFFYDANIGTDVDCAGHNFVRQIFLP